MLPLHFRLKYENKNTATNNAIPITNLMPKVPSIAY